ncbi:pyridoxamine 5'-phosphate oxidase family protein [Actinomycetospora termitidis]|uniref:Pyridoxamine 5'-phosphate oxidase family protein n=1 Tax=Actinomycetospora termitidis TaxID=3053470 RepID=A0ABT7MGU9_9PSEU|nr:pyridoxamine 5'-phosphate oxidase family protein [Actinomycetospora sp. Odt1-22]MDL5159909.1 pyridoxamine 5'-phosphate oxidase family protein [Actinomycetospora sp. Odt1-22]
MSRFAHLTSTAPVRAVQEEQGSLRANARRLAGGDAEPDALGPLETEFVGDLDGFYLATVNADGWPYIQYRGGPAGFVHVLDEHTLAFADVRGNRQYLSAGNLRTSDKVALFFMRYSTRTRLKVLGHARSVRLDEEPELAARVSDVRTDGVVERLVVVDVEGVDWNCPQHITPRFTVDEIQEGVGVLQARIEELERENRRLRSA